MSLYRAVSPAREVRIHATTPWRERGHRTNQKKGKREQNQGIAFCSPSDSLLIVGRCDSTLVCKKPGYGRSATEGTYNIAEQGCKRANEIFPTTRSFY